MPGDRGKHVDGARRLDEVLRVRRGWAVLV